MGTRVTVTLIHSDGGEARTLVTAAFDEMERLEAILSRHREGTSVDRLNRDGILHDAPPELTHLLAESIRYSELTGGAFDSTVAPLVRLYEAAAMHTGGPPRDSEIDEALLLVDYRELHVDGNTVALGRPGMAVTLDGIAKGYIADRAAQILLNGGAEQVMIEAGGDVASIGGDSRPEGWQLGIQDPRDPGALLGLIRTDNEGVATSGDYMQAFSADLSVHHIVDPRTGRSPGHTSGVTVIAPTATEADALSTSVFVLGPVTGIELLNRLEGREGLVVTKDQRKITTPGFARRYSGMSVTRT